MAIPNGTRLGNYQILAPLGAGGMGEVYRARDLRLGREVAVKVLPEALASDPDRLARFEREARAAAALTHPNIVVLHSTEEADGVRFLTMELVEGETLASVIMPGGLPLDRLLALAIPLGDALTAAHEKGIVHRDLKPANVMITRQGQVKVLDFGLAKLSRPEPEIGVTQAATMESPASTAGQLLGTAPYMSPEQIRGEPADSRSDLFSFGVILFELATGVRPFRGKTFADVSSAILRDPAPALGSLRPDLPRDLERIIGRCLEKDREQRSQTARDVRNELDIVRRETVLETSSSTSIRDRRPHSPAASDTDVPSIAVLPFANRSRDEEDEYFSDGLADELLSVLAKTRGVRVAARTSSATFKGKSVTIAEVGEALHVATVLEGSVRKAGNRVRIAVQLVKVEDGYPLWSETYDRTLDDVFAVQDDIAQSVVKELRAALLGESDSEASGEARADLAAAAGGRGTNPEAHRLYLQGKYLIDRLSAEDLTRGIGYLHQALAIDPGHALAWVNLAQALSQQGGYGWAPLMESYRNAREAAMRAMSLAPDLAEAHVMLSRIQRMHDWNWQEAQASSRRALELAPDNAEVLREAAQLAQTVGRLEEALDLLRRSIERDPLNAVTYGQLGYLLRSMGRLEEAKDTYRKSLDLSPRRITAHHLIAIILADEGRDADAMVEANQEPAEWSRLTSLAYVHHLAGRKVESDEALEALETKYPDDTAIQIASLRSARGEADLAFAWLERAYEQRDAGLSMMKSEPTLRPLHGDPRWPAFLRKMGLEA